MKRTLLLTLVLVVVVIFLFLRNAWATLIPSLALPLSVVGTFPVMYVLGYSLDTLSLMALTLAVGFVVDDAIVMLENIVRHMEMGKPPMQAAIDGAAEVGFTIFSMTLSLTAGIHPAAFSGRRSSAGLFREFAVVIATAILVSGVVSLTFTPMLASRFLRAHRRASGTTGLQRHRARVRLAPRPVHVDARLDDAASPARDGVFGARARRRPSCCSSWCRPDSSRRRTSARSTSRPRRRRATSFDDMVRRQQAIAGDRAA